MSKSCPPVRSELTLDEAEAIIDPYFTVVRDVFVEAGAARTKKTKLEIARWAHDKPRHFAATEETGRKIVVSPEFAELPEDTVLAILSHEFGHVVDFLYPGRYMVVDDGELVEMPEVPEFDPDAEIDPRALEAVLARERFWNRRDKDAVERTADAIAEFFTGRLIGYAGPCELQSFDRGMRPRRAGLR